MTKNEMKEKRMDEICSSNKTDHQKVVEIMRLESDSDWVIKATDFLVFVIIPIAVILALVSLIVHII